MDYSVYNLKEKAQIAAIIKAIADNVSKLLEPGQKDNSSLLSQFVTNLMYQRFEQNFMSVVNSELTTLKLPKQLVDNATLSPFVWKSMKGQREIIEHLQKIFITDMKKNEETAYYSGLSQLAIINVFNIRLQ